MGSYTFRWDHPADEVYVTGTFDDWKKSTKLDKVGSAHEKTVELPKSDDKVWYKFVADGDWKHDPTAKTEQDHNGNTNNVLYPEDIMPSSGLGGAAISSVAPGATTTDMAGEQPVEKSTPGAFPETPAADDDKTFSVNPIPASEGPGNPIQLTPGEPVPATDKSITSNVHDDLELKSKDEGDQTFGVSPIPASSGIENPIQLTPGQPVPDSKSSDQAYGVAPIPASGGIGNPIQLAPGEKVPDSSTISGNTIDSTARTDQASYEKSDASASVVQPNSGTLQDRVTPAEGVFGTVGGAGPVIPESGMSSNSTDINKEDTGPTTSSVAPGATTTELAGQQPKEPRGTPTVVKDDREVDPTLATVGAGATTAGLAGAVAKEPRGEPTVIKDSTQESTNDPTISSVGAGSTTAALAGQQPKEERGVPEVVSESQQEAKTDPEAAANPTAVEEKKDVEQELKKEVPEAPSTSESGMFGKSENGVGAKVAAGVAGAGVAAAGAAVAANEFLKDKTGTDVKSKMPETVQSTVDEKAKESAVPEKAAGSSTDAARETTTSVPTEVTESRKEAGEPAEAAASPEAVKEKSAMENELLSKVPTSDAKGAPAPTESAAATESAPTATSSSGTSQLRDPTTGVAALSMDDKPATGAGDGGQEPKAPTPMDSRDVSPMSRPATQQTPEVTTGVGNASTPSKSEPPKGGHQRKQSIIDKLKAYKPDSPESSSKTSSATATPTKTSAESKKKENRRSFFGKIKDKLK